MKKIILSSLVLLTIFLGSCELDNYSAPNATFTGAIIDSQTNKPIQQDLFSGSVIDYVEQGYANANTQQLRFHTDGTFANLLMFAGKYTVQAVRGNFATTEIEEITISGNTVHDFKTLPYLRIIDPVIVLNGDKSKVIATFKVENVVGSKIKEIGIFADFTNSVGSTLANNGQVLKPINVIGNPATVYTIELPTTSMKKGFSYYVRVGAKADVAESKYNYETAVKVTL